MAIPNASSHTVRGACGHDCPDTCGWVVEVSGGDATRLIGDRTHPFTRGTLCAKVNHYLERVYHPDRLLHPLKRIGPKGSGRFERVTWDAALADARLGFDPCQPRERTRPGVRCVSRPDPAARGDGAFRRAD